MGVPDRDWWRTAQQCRQARGMPERSTAALMRRSTLGIVVFWLVVMSVLYVAMDSWRAPRPAVVAADGALVIPRGADGHFRVAGTVNGQPVMFMVDTGASTVVVTDALAQRAGLSGGEPTRFRTANGVSQGRMTTAQSVVVRSFAMSAVRVGVGYSGENADDALLGQNFLQHFDVQMLRDRMVLRPRR